ncbi:trimethylamine:corrinoid methyltransferase [Kiritimatiella glycovorans]|uniref:Trimethylamine:corrinoid methyltransferase n=2 Tax=Kiritimatiella glycovorans TaxID=1307763 RepID=A0A0G3EEU8_9BACT|nr:trimethylamine:corrinoid methyltransferase [Kiritimatiella glycovorans]
MTNATKQREGVLVKPKCRLSEDQIAQIDRMSRELLENPGLICYNAQTAELLKEAGAEVQEETSEYTRIRIPSSLIDRVVESAPSTVTLGARNPDNRLVLDAHEPRVRFGSGSETNFWLDLDFENGKPVFTRKPGSIEQLCRTARLCDRLENLDFFIRCINIRDRDIDETNKDVNKFLASLNNITKHVQAGLTSLDALEDVLNIGRIIAGGEDAFRENPVLSFITCVIKSPMQVTDDTADKLIAIARAGAPVVISSCPMGGATGPFDEFGMVAQINAELLAGVCINQCANPGAPVLYGAVPVRTRLDNLNDMYGAPEFVHYNLDCAQMARHYGLPCYSTAGVADTSEPGIQATVEKMLTYMTVPQGGAQYIHYAFGLLERTNTFSPEQAILDDAQIGIAKRALAEPDVSEERYDEVRDTIREVMDSDHKSYVYHLPLPTEEPVYVAYPYEDGDEGPLKAAQERYREILAEPAEPLPEDILQRLRDEVPGILDATLKS